MYRLQEYQMTGILLCLLLHACSGGDSSPAKTTQPEYTIGGSVSGLLGTGLVLQNNLGDDLSLLSDGAFSFAMAIKEGAAYSVTVHSQPVAPTQTCTVSNATGTVAEIDISDIVVTCELDPVTLQAPVLKWAYGGCTTFCLTGWYSSPAVTDLDSDGKPEILAGNYTLYALNGEDGSEQWKMASPGLRIWPGIVVDDIDNDNVDEIVFASGGDVMALTLAGSVIWDTTVSGSEIRSLSAYDLDHDETIELVAGIAIGSDQSMTVLEHTGMTRSGWPQLDGSTSSVAFGVYNSNIAVGDIDQTGDAEIIAPSDVHYINAFLPGGNEITANAFVYGIDKFWGMIPVYENPADEVQGYSNCSGLRDYRTNFATGPAAIADMDADGVREVIVTGNTREFCTLPVSQQNSVYMFNRDRTRFQTTIYDWRTPPLDITGPPLTEDDNVIEPGMPNAAIADIDNDGSREIVFSSYDGKVHAVWLDKTEHGNWPYAINHGSDGFFRLSGEPVIADLTHDGQAEIIVASWTEKGSNAKGRLHIIDSIGNKLFEVDLPDALNAADWNGALAAPTLANVDDDPYYEIVLNTVNAGVVVYDLPGIEYITPKWMTGRGNYQRNAYLP